MPCVPNGRETNAMDDTAYYCGQSRDDRGGSAPVLAWGCGRGGPAGGGSFSFSALGGLLVEAASAYLAPTTSPAICKSTASRPCSCE
ncbi:hypothetical protein VTI28DRAFT_8817 [Corynascus sepedonium]